METKQEIKRKRVSIKEIQSYLQEITGTGQLKNFLDTITRQGLSFRNYSFYNTLLIACQRPGFSYVAGMKKWNSLGRRVRKGEHAIWIYAPGEFDEEENRQKFFLVRVFDLSQTEGPNLHVETLTGQASIAALTRPGSIIALKNKIIEYIRQVLRLEYAETETPGPKGSNGAYTPGKKIEVFNSGRRPESILSTLFHEAGHHFLYKAGDITGPENEARAQAISYCLCKYFKIDNLQFTNLYIEAHLKGLQGTELYKILKLTIDNTITFIKTFTDFLDGKEPQAPVVMPDPVTETETKKQALAVTPVRVTEAKAQALAVLTPNDKRIQAFIRLGSGFNNNNNALYLAKDKSLTIGDTDLSLTLYGVDAGEKDKVVLLPTLAGTNLNVKNFPLIKLEGLGIAGKFTIDERAGLCAHKDITKRTLNTVFFDLQQGKLVSTDGYRLSAIDCQAVIDREGEGCKIKDFLLPLRAFNLLVKLSAIEGRKEFIFEVDSSGQAIRIRGMNYTITSCLVEEAFPDYRQVIPDIADLTKVEGFTLEGIRELEKTVKQNKPFFKNKNTVYIDGDKLIYEDKNSKMQEVKLNSINMQGFRYSARYIIDLLEFMKNTHYHFYGSSKQPGVLDCSGYRVLIMPIRKD